MNAANYQEPKMLMVDSKDGHVVDLEKSGLVPKYAIKQVSTLIS